MTKFNQNQVDLFSFFSEPESFSTPSERIENDKGRENGAKANIKSFKQKDISEQSKGSGELILDDDSCEEDENEALAHENTPDEEALNRAELSGKQLNTQIKEATSIPKKEEKKPEFNRGTYIAYARQTISITKLFNEESLGTLDLDTVRQRLEKDFPELSKQRTRMDWEEKKNLICPVVTGGKKGSFFTEGIKGFFYKSKDLYENIQAINILAAKDGYYEVRENEIGVFVSKVTKIEELEVCREGFKFSLPKIPQNLFTQLISFFADYSLYEVEVMGVLYWDTEKNIYILDVPNQKVSKSRIMVQFSEFPLQFLKVAEIHSHNTMRSYFSEIDDKDELGTMLYGVVGRLQKEEGNISFDLETRAGVAGRFIPLEPSRIIEGEYSETSSKRLQWDGYPAEWHDRVQIVEPQSLEYGGHLA